MVFNRKTYLRMWRARNPDYEKLRWADLGKRVKRYACHRRWVIENRERVRVYLHNWYLGHREQQLRWQSDWATQNPGKVRATRARRRARELRAASDQWSWKDIEKIYARQAGLCYYCRIELNGVFDVEHKIPLCRGGSDRLENICCSCEPCNQRKSRKTDEEFSSVLASEASSI